MLNIKTYFLITLCVLFWSVNFVIGRFIKDDITPLELAFFRWFFVFLIISPILIVRYKRMKNECQRMSARHSFETFLIFFLYFSSFLFLVCMVWVKWVRVLL